MDDKHDLSLKKTQALCHGIVERRKRLVEQCVELRKEASDHIRSLQILERLKLRRNQRLAATAMSSISEEEEA